MSCYALHPNRLTVVAAAGILLTAVGIALAQQQSLVVPPQSAAPPVTQPAPPVPPPQPILVPPTTNGATESMPVPSSHEATVHTAPRITYHAGPRARRMLACNEQVQLVMVTKNPIDCCLYEIPLCVPACCEGQPAMRERRGFLGAGIVEYCWPCGFVAKVKFRPMLCDVKVDYSVD